MTSDNEDSDDNNIGGVKRVVKRIADSDSEDEDNLFISNSKAIKDNDSDSEGLELDENTNERMEKSFAKVNKLIDSDSDSEIEKGKSKLMPDDGYFVEKNSQSVRNSPNNAEKTVNGSNLNSEMYNADDSKSDRSESNQFQLEPEKPVYKPIFNSDIYDAEDSDDDRPYLNQPQSDNEERDSSTNHVSDENISKKSKGKKSQPKEKKEKKKKEKVKSSEEGMREIRRESQRMIRESSCILPYHRPKQRTLAEFIQRRKTVPSIPLKTNQEHLIKIGKQIEELEKQSEEFFKSDASEDSDDEYIPECIKNKNKTDNSSRNSNLVIELVNEESDLNNSNSEETRLNESLRHAEQIIQETDIMIEKAKKKLFEDDKISELAQKTDISSQINIENNETEFFIKDSEDFTLELKINEDSNQILESANFVVDSSIIDNQNTSDIVVMNIAEESSFTNLNKKIKESEISSTNHNYENSEDFSLRIEESETIHYEKNNMETENSSNSMENESINPKKQNFTVTEKITNLNENSEGYVSNEDEHVNRSNLFKNKFMGLNIDFTKIPELIGNSNEKINLYSPPKSSAILELKNRFFKHFAMDKKVKAKENMEISVVTAEMSSEGTVNCIKHETINASISTSDKWIQEVKDAQPGSKLTKLKAHLERQLEERWKEDFKKRVEEHKINEEEKMDDDAKSDYEDEAILDDENIDTDLTETESEEEPEENDILLVDKKRPQSKFFDEEADETDGEDNENGIEFEENEDDLLGNNESDDDDSKSELVSNNEEESNLEKELEQNKRVEKLDGSEEIFSKSLIDDDFSPKDKGMNNRKLSFEIGDMFEKSQPEPVKFWGIEDLIDQPEGFDKLSQTDIIDICSGKFLSQSENFSQAQNEDLSSQFYTEQSQGFTQSGSFQDKLSIDKENQDDEFRKNTSILDSDDEGDLFEKSQKKKIKKIVYSDDEDGSEDDNKSEKESDADDENNLIEDEAPADVEYDSEENEIIKDGKGFLDKEAELSESEWGSEDEDEKDLDNFEAELGDEDDLDQEQIKGELGKIHMQRMLVDDKNDVRLLKELLLEDGELHSDESGRVRKFRWANADDEDVGGQNNFLNDSDDDSDHGEEDDENWRRKRHEREVYIQKQQEKLRELGIDDVIDEKKDGEGDDLLDLGRTIVKKFNSIQNPPKPLSQLQKINNLKIGIGSSRLTNSNCIKKGSFLQSSNHYLSRLANISSKVGSEGSVQGPKNSRNFVFSIVSPPKKEPEESENNSKMVKKRKAKDNLESSKKKIHFDEIQGNGQHKSLLEILTASQ